MATTINDEKAAREKAAKNYWEHQAHQDLATFILNNPDIGERLVYELHQHFQRGSLLTWATRAVRDELRKCCKEWVDKNWGVFV